jgi:hypothetical protein
MSEQDDFLIGNNRLDESLLMDMSDMPVEQSAAKPAGRKKKSPAKRNTSSTVRKKNSATAKQSSGESSSRNDDGTSNRRNGGQAERNDAVPSNSENQSSTTPPPRFNSQPVEPADVKPVSQQNDGTVDEDTIDIDSLLEDPWGSPSSDTGETVEQDSGMPVEQSPVENGVPAEQPYSEPVGQSAVGTEEQSAFQQEQQFYGEPAEQQTGATENQQSEDDIDPFSMWNIQEQSDASTVGRNTVNPDGRQNSETANRQNGGQAEQDSIWRMDDIPQQAEPQQSDYPDSQQDSQADIWSIDSPEQQYADGQAQQSNGETANQSNDDFWNTGEPAQQQTSMPEQQSDDVQAFQQNGEQDIWGDNPTGGQVQQSNGETADRQASEQDFWGDESDAQPVQQSDSGQAIQSDGEQDIWGDNSTGGTATQLNGIPESQPSNEPDIWGSSDDNSPYGQNAAPVAYDDIWGDEIPVQQPEPDDGGQENQYDNTPVSQFDTEPANQQNGEQSNQPDDDFYRRNSIFNDHGEGQWWEDGSNVQEQSAPQQQQSAPQQEDDGFWDDSIQANQFDSTPVGQPSGFPPQQFDGELPDYADDAEAESTTDGEGDGGRIRKIIIMVVVILAGIALLCGGGYYAYSTYTHAQAEKARQVEIQKKQDSLTKAQNNWDKRVSDAKDLIKEIKNSLVKDDKTTLGECDKLSKATEGNPMTEAAIGKKMKALNAQYKATGNAYRKALQSKSADVSNKLKSLIDQAGKLGDAPDSSDKKTMNSLVKQWKDTQVTADNVADANKAVSSLQDVVGKVSKAKTDADNAKKAEEEAKRKAEEEAQAQAQQQQQSQQTYTPQRQYTYTYTPQRQYTAPRQQQSTPSTPTAPSTPSQPSTGGDGNSGVMF